MPTDDITYYKPSLPQELQCNKGDAAFDFLYDMFYTLPTGEAIKKPVLIVFAGATTSGTPEVTTYKAWNCNASIILKDFNTVDEKIIFDININSIAKGTVVLTAGVPTFTATV